MSVCAARSTSSVAVVGTTVCVHATTVGKQLEQQQWVLLCGKKRNEQNKNTKLEIYSTKLVNELNGIVSINRCDLLSYYHQGTPEVSRFIPNTDPESASRPCCLAGMHKDVKVMTLNGVKVNISK